MCPESLVQGGSLVLGLWGWPGWGGPASLDTSEHVTFSWVAASTAQQIAEEHALGQLLLTEEASGVASSQPPPSHFLLWLPP